MMNGILSTKNFVRLIMKDHPGRCNPVELSQYLVVRYQSTIRGAITILVMVTQVHMHR